jgi:L-iditol 2-dehydrogenase
MEESLNVRGLIITAPLSVSMSTFDLRLPSEEYVKVKVEACGLCTWEQRVYRGTKPTYPFWGGHEVSGVVSAIEGKNTQNLKTGDRVALALMRRCGQCHWCVNDLDNHCVYIRPEAQGTFPSGPRGLSDLMLVPPYQVFPLGVGVKPWEGALVEPIACVLRSVDKGQVKSGDTALVIGGGTMGLIHTSLLKIRGCKVVVVDEDATNRRRVRLAGADWTFSWTRNDLAKAILRLTEGRGADAVFCTRGGTDAVKFSTKVVGRGGRIVLFQSILGSRNVSVDANDLHYREIQILGTISQTREDFQRAVDLVSTCRDFLKSLKTESVKAEFANRAFEKATSRKFNRVLVRFD